MVNLPSIRGQCLGQGMNADSFFFFVFLRLGWGGGFGMCCFGCDVSVVFFVVLRLHEFYLVFWGQTTLFSLWIWGMFDVFTFVF